MQTQKLVSLIAIIIASIVLIVVVVSGVVWRHYNSSYVNTNKLLICGEYNTIVNDIDNVTDNTVYHDTDKSVMYYGGVSVSYEATGLSSVFGLGDYTLTSPAFLTITKSTVGGVDYFAASILDYYCINVKNSVTQVISDTIDLIFTTANEQVVVDSVTSMGVRQIILQYKYVDGELVFVDTTQGYGIKATNSIILGTRYSFPAYTERGVDQLNTYGRNFVLLDGEWYSIWHNTSAYDTWDTVVRNVISSSIVRDYNNSPVRLSVCLNNLVTSNHYTDLVNRTSTSVSAGGACNIMIDCVYEEV